MALNRPGTARAVAPEGLQAPLGAGGVLVGVGVLDELPGPKTAIFCPLSALHAHTKRPYQNGLPWENAKAVQMPPGGPDGVALLVDGVVRDVRELLLVVRDPALVALGREPDQPGVMTPAQPGGPQIGSSH
jgi:hypothetical protein